MSADKRVESPELIQMCDIPVTPFPGLNARIFNGIVITVLCACLFCFVSGCTKERSVEESGERVFATVNGVHLTESELREMVPRDFYNRLTPDHKRKIIDDWIDRELLFQEALNRKIDEETDIRLLLHSSKRNLLSNELLERELSSIKMPTEAELKLFYNNNKSYFELATKEYQVRYALFDNTKDATSFVRKVRKNESFSTLAREVSKHPSSREGGDLGMVNEDSVEPQIWDAILSTIEKRGIRKVSDPFRVIDGWGCVIADEVLESGTVKPFEFVRDLVLDMCIAEDREKSEEQLIENLTSSAEIEYNYP